MEEGVAVEDIEIGLEPTNEPIEEISSGMQNVAEQSQGIAADTRAYRVESPYDVPPLAFPDINVATRAALVNIFCTPHDGTLRPISGSGVIVDSRGVILTNAHVAQYVLLSQDPRINLTCTIRTGSPARAAYGAEVLYVPEAWINEHYADINITRPLGTGEHDYAFLAIVKALSGSALPPSFPSISIDAREGAAFFGDSVLAASYPAEFTGGSVSANLHAVSSVSKIDNLYTFRDGSVDVISIGSVIEAQSGSSGGAIVNAWGKLVGVITTTSEGATTGERTLRGITTSYVERDLLETLGIGHASLLSGDVMKNASTFGEIRAPALTQKYVEYLAGQ